MPGQSPSNGVPCHPGRGPASAPLLCLIIGEGTLWEECSQHKRNDGLQSMAARHGLIMLPDIRDVRGAFSWLPCERGARRLSGKVRLRHHLLPYRETGDQRAATVSTSRDTQREG